MFHHTAFCRLAKASGRKKGRNPLRNLIAHTSPTSLSRFLQGDPKCIEMYRSPLRNLVAYTFPTSLFGLLQVDPKSIETHPEICTTLHHTTLHFSYFFVFFSSKSLDVLANIILCSLSLPGISQFPVLNYTSPVTKRWIIRSQGLSQIGEHP